MPEIALIVDHPQRDLLGLLLVVRRLCESGVTCHLVPAWLAEKEISGIAPDLVLFNHLRMIDERAVEMSRDIGSVVAILDTEGGVIESFDRYRQSLSRRSDLRDAVRCYCAWGPRFAEQAQHQSWFPQSDVVVTGPPRFDFYADPWRSIVPALDGAVAESAQSTVLLAGTFTLANSRFLSVEDECKLLVKEAHLEPEFVERRLRSEREALDGMVRLSGELAAWAPEVDWVYRPHPFERSDTYEKALSGNVQLRCNGSIQNWLLSARALIQRGSTTAIEAAIAGVPVLTPDWLPDWSEVRTIQLVSTRCGSLGEMQEALDSTLNSSPHNQPPELSEDARSAIQDWFFESDGCAHARVADALLQSLANGGAGVNRDRALSWFTGALPESSPLVKRIAGRLRRIAGVPADFSFTQMRRRKEKIAWDSGGRTFDAGTVNRILGQIHCAASEGRVGPPAVPLAMQTYETDAYPLTYSLGRSVTVIPCGSSVGR